VRPVNLIPADQRRGSARVPGAAAPPVRVYVLLGVLGVALIGVLAFVLTSNQISSKTEQLAKVQVQEQGVKQVADALRPYGQFAQVQQARQTQIDALVSSRFDWERALRQLSQAIPSNVWLLNLSGTVSPSIDVSSSGGGGDVSSLRQKAMAPAFAISGCTWSQHAVARMMTRMQNLDDVTDVQLAKSARKDAETTSSGTTAPQTASDQQSAAQSSTDCVGSSRITMFDMLVVFGGAPGAQTQSTDVNAAGGAVAPSSTQQNLGTAQNAASTAQGASAASTGGAANAGTGGTP
jgi:Tfp pilus assembly protein PilN